MVIATFRAGTTTAGQTIEYENNVLWLSGGSRVTAREVVQYDQAGQLTWVEEAARNWLYENQEPPGSSSVALETRGPATIIDDNYRTQLLAQAIYSSGLRVESQGPFNAVVVTGTPVNHILHLLLTLLTAGLWLPVWIIVAIAGGEVRYMYAVDPFGNVFWQKI